MNKYFKPLLFSLCWMLSTGITQAGTVAWKCTINNSPWVEKSPLSTTAWDNDNSSYISVDEAQTDQEIEDWGGCIIEKAWDGLMKLSQTDRDAAVKAMYDTVEGIYTNARCAIGMNDMSMNTRNYSDDEFPNDYTMEKFNITRDKEYLIPFIKAAMVYNPHLKVWATPWSPPTWMKTRNSFYGGRLKADPQVRQALALYIEKWVKAYREENINVFAVFHQNEPQHENDNWLVTHYEPEDFRDFLRDYLYPKFRQDDMHVECGVGTSVSDDNPPRLIPAVMNDTLANSYSTNIAIQYSIPNATYCRKTWPNKRLWQSETPAGNGSNDWPYAEENWAAMRDYLQNGVNSYSQWDVADVKGGTSNEYKPFSAPVVIDTVKKTVILTPAYYQIKHFTYFVKPGALRIKSTGNYSDHVAFVNRNGGIAVVVANTTNSNSSVAININGQKIKPTLPAHSFNTFTINGTPISDISPFNKIEAEAYTGQSGTFDIPCGEGGKCLSYIHNNEWAYYYHINFGKGAGGFQARVAATVGGSIEVHLDSVTSDPVATCKVDPTGGVTTWKTVSSDFTKSISGSHKLYLKFKGTGNDNLFNLNWWKFDSATVGIKTVPESRVISVNEIKFIQGSGKIRTLHLDISRQATMQKVNVCMFDLNGHLVSTLFKGRMSASHIELPFSRAEIRTGSYVITVAFNDKICLSKKIVLR